MNFSQLLAEADKIIEKRASQINVPAIEENDDIFKLAEQVRQIPVANTFVNNDTFVFTESEKTACTMAVMETLLSLNELNAIDHLEKVAEDRGFSQEQLQNVFTKVAEHNKTGSKVINFIYDTSAKMLQQMGI